LMTFIVKMWLKRIHESQTNKHRIQAAD